VAKLVPQGGKNLCKKAANSWQKFVLRAQNFIICTEENSICTAKIAISIFSHTLGIFLSF
jgi:hypothetical protein